MNKKEKLVIVGAGMASGRMLEHLFEADRDRFDITLFGAEPHGNYNRIMLSPVLAGEKTFDEIVINDAAWYDANRSNCRFGETVTRIDRAAKTVHSASGETALRPAADRDRLRSLHHPGCRAGPAGRHDLSRLSTMSQAMLAAAENGGNAVVIGGGLLGLEAAAALRLHGMKVTVLHLMGHLMERQLDEAAGYLLQKRAGEPRHQDSLPRPTPRRSSATARVEAVLLEDGTVIPADLVVMAVGIRPEAAHRQASGPRCRARHPRRRPAW